MNTYHTKISLDSVCLRYLRRSGTWIEGSKGDILGRIILNASNNNSMRGSRKGLGDLKVIKVLKISLGRTKLSGSRTPPPPPRHTSGSTHTCILNPTVFFSLPSFVQSIFVPLFFYVFLLHVY